MNARRKSRLPVAETARRRRSMHRKPRLPAMKRSRSARSSTYRRPRRSASMRSARRRCCRTRSPRSVRSPMPQRRCPHATPARRRRASCRHVPLPRTEHAFTQQHHTGAAASAAPTMSTTSHSTVARRRLDACARRDLDATALVQPPSPVACNVADPCFILNHMVQCSQPRFDASFAALSDVTRRGVLEQLGRADASITELAEKFHMTLTGMKKHVGVLEQAGLVTTEKVGRVRTCKLGPRRLAEEAAWIEAYRQLWAARFDELDKVVEELKGKEKVDGRKKRE